jgi:hypothetical protein
MKIHTLIITLIVLFLSGAAVAGLVNANETERTPLAVQLYNVRDYAPATHAGGLNFAVDGGKLYTGDATGWHLVPTPSGVMVNAVALHPQQDSVIYVGAANEVAVYVSSDSSQSWLKIPLAAPAIGAVTAIAVDGTNRLVYVGTDTDGVYRLRDVGSSMIASGHLLLDEPVEEIVAAASVAYIRTRWQLYRAEDMGLRWVSVENLPSPATALAIAQTTPPTVYVGTASSGVRASQDGINWQSVNNGLAFAPGSQLYVNSLAVDAAQPQVVYAATSVIFGSANAHVTPLGVSMSSDGAAGWSELAAINDVAVVELLPVSGRTGALYALTETSRTPLALGSAPLMAAVAAPVESGRAIDMSSMAILAWVLAGLAAAGFALLLLETRQHRHTFVPVGTAS